MWLANSKRQPCFYPPVTRTRRHTELTKNDDKADGKPVLCQRTFGSVFGAVCLHSLTAQFNLECMGPLENARHVGQ
jgi:hypothetical protein